MSEREMHGTGCLCLGCTGQRPRARHEVKRADIPLFIVEEHAVHGFVMSIEARQWDVADANRSLATLIEHVHPAFAFAIDRGLPIDMVAGCVAAAMTGLVNAHRLVRTPRGWTFRTN